MKTVIIAPTSLDGKIKVPPSKSISHRAIIGAALAKGKACVNNLLLSEDIKATIEGMKALGASIHLEDDSCISIQGIKETGMQIPTIDCKESGSTLRFLIPVASVIKTPATFTGEGRLGKRPLTPYYDIFSRQNIDYETTHGQLPLKVTGSLKPDDYYIPGDISSQFITGLLYALPLLDGDSTIHITTELESKGYIDLTLDVLKHYSIQIHHENYKTFKIKGNQSYVSQDYTVEGDYSQAAFWIVAGLIDNGLTIEGMRLDSGQGDRMILDIVKQMGGKIVEEEHAIHILPSVTHGIEIDASQCPDLVPILSVLAAVSKGTTKIINAARLRIKESDRLASTTSELNKLGAEIIEAADSLTIHGKDHLKGGIVDSWNDHRIAMALAVASIRCTDQVKITNSDTVKKSYPTFWEDFKKLGGEIDEFDLGK